MFMQIHELYFLKSLPFVNPQVLHKQIENLNDNVQHNEIQRWSNAHWNINSQVVVWLIKEDGLLWTQILLKKWGLRDGHEMAHEPIQHEIGCLQRGGGKTKGLNGLQSFKCNRLVMDPVFRPPFPYNPAHNSHFYPLP